MKNQNQTFCINNTLYSCTELISYCRLVLLKKDISDWQTSFCLFVLEWLSETPNVIAYTSGSTGQPKQIIISKEAMTCSARKTLRFLSLVPTNTALLCLSANYIAGKMMIVRAFIGSLNLICVEPDSLPLRQCSQPIDFAAMVPMQVINTVEHGEELKQVKKLIIGGGQVSAMLQNDLKNYSIEIYETYGMTETVSHIALKRLSGDANSYFSVLENISLAQDKRGCLVIDAPELHDGILVTNDVVEMADENSFRFIGRIDHVINSGGVKIQPEIIEEQLRKVIPDEFYISSKIDTTLGERLVLVLLKNGASLVSIDSSFRHLNKIHRPKEIVYVDEFPHTPSGKIDRIALSGLIRNK